MKRPSLKYFAYGSNMHPLRMRQRVPSSRTLVTAELPGYSLRFHKRGGDGSGKCNVFYTGTNIDRVFGAIYEMDTAERHLLDQAEGLGIGYSLTSLTLTTADRQHDVFSYVADDEHIDNELQPYAWYKALVVQGARIHGLPQHYISGVQEVSAIIDPDLKRTALHLRILALRER